MKRRILHLHTEKFSSAESESRITVRVYDIAGKSRAEAPVEPRASAAAESERERGLMPEFAVSDVPLHVCAEQSCLQHLRTFLLGLIDLFRHLSALHMTLYALR